MASEFERLQAALPERYTLLRELDRGGMSRVYLARESLPERDVAIKVLDEELSARLGRARFVREVEVTSQLVHPHIVPIYAAGDAQGALYYVMPFIEGESLRDRLEREGALPLEEALAIAQQVSNALEHAHLKDIVHRDIKPANILFQSGHAVVADFGIARALRAAESGGEFTQTGLPIGTPDYMSPEQAGADQPIDGRTDVYGLACVLYEMIAGQPPFRSRSPQATLARQLTDPMPSLRALREGVPRGVENVIRRALAKEPEDRFAAVADFAEALQNADRRVTGAVPFLIEQTRHVGVFGLSLRVAGTLLVVAALGVAWQAWSSDAPRSVLAESPYQDSVAIMPFSNRTGDSSLDNLGRSVADEVIGRLAQVSEVKVIGSYSVVSLWNQNLGVPRLLDTLNVGYLIEGYYEMRGGEIVINVSELDEQGVVQDRTTYTADPSRLDSAQLAIAHAVADAFLDRVGVTATFALDHEEYGPGRDAYLAGKSWLGQRTAASMRRAVTQFREAIDLEPTHAPAYAALSSAFALALYYKYDVGIPQYDLAAQALAYADRAVELDPDLAEAYSARGYAKALLGIDIDAAEADFARAGELAPNAPNGPSWSARILAQRGRIDEAYRQARRARDLDPLQAGRRTALVSLAFQLGNYDEAIEEAREALRLQPELTLATAFEGRAMALTGRGEDCLALDFGVYDLVRALCLHASGRQQEARDMVQTAGEALTSTGSGDPDYLDDLAAQDLASYYGFVGDAVNATRWLRYAFQLSPSGVDTRILGSELFDSVRDDRTFASAVEEVRRKAQARVIAEWARLRTEGRP